MENLESRDGPSRKRGRPLGCTSRRNEDGKVCGKFRHTLNYRKAVVLKRNPDGYVEHMGQNILVWLERGLIVQTKLPKNNCPTGTAYGKVNYLLRKVVLSNGGEIVECINEHGKLLGVRPWIYTTANVMEPNDSQWFFVYEGKIFRVRIDPATKAVKKVTLAAKNENEVAQGEKFEEVDMAGLKFAIIRGTDRAITGAELLPCAPPSKVVDEVPDLNS